MKTKNSKTPTSVHVRVERFFRHRSFLSIVLSIMALGFIKYQSHALAIMHEIYYGQGVSMLSSYTHHEEITRMPVSYGAGARVAPISGE
jgi:hypothetical protein